MAEGADSAGNKVESQTTQASGTGAVAVNTPHIIQYPKQHRRDDGKWMALASVIGAIAGHFASKKLIDRAEDAESTWRKVNDELFNRGKDVWARTDPEYDLAKQSEPAIEESADWNLAVRNSEYDYANLLNPCNDELHDRLCKLILCGYKPDYRGIATRAIALGQAEAAKSRAEVVRVMSRYRPTMCCDSLREIETARIMATVVAVSTGRESERQKAWEINSNLLSTGVNTFEQHRANRLNTANTHDTNYTTRHTTLYSNRMNNYHKMSALGADFLTSAGKNYGFLADSYRKTAEKQSSDIASFIPMLAAIGLGFSGPIASLFEGKK